MKYTDFFYQVQSQLDAELPLVMFKKPNEVKISGLLQPTKALRTGTDFEREGFVFSPFAKGKEPIVWMYNNECEYIETVFKDVETGFNTKKNAKIATDVKKRHVCVVQKAIDELTSGELQKVVISRSEFQNIDTLTPVEWFKRICNAYSNTFCYCWYHPRVGMWLGATPETLISLSEKKFTTMALAGTIPFKGVENVSWGVKEKEEQQMVVDSILKALNPVTELVEKGNTTTQKSGALLHLKTIISGKINNLKDLKVLVEVLHPTSAVCGLPQVKSKKFILNNEGYNRSYYTGYLGVYSLADNTDLYVNLRCMQVHKNNVEIYVGGGITSLSNAEAEWEETVNKSLIMKKIL